MNLADLAAAIIVIVGCLSGPAAANEMNSPWWHYPLLLPLGIAVSLALAFISGRFSYFLLRSDHPIAFVAYPVFSLIAMIAGGALTMLCTFEMARALLQ